MGLERISSASEGIISLEDAKEFLRILSTDMDNEITDSILSATSALDVNQDGVGGIGFPILSQQWSRKGDGFTPELLLLPFAAKTTIDDVRYYDVDGELQTVDAGIYHLIKVRKLWRVNLLPDFCWPSVQCRPDAVEIRFTSGWAAVDDIPDDILVAAKILMRLHYEARGSFELKNSEYVERAVNSLTARYRSFVL